ncbi:MAG: SGNH/GDSL hydrolase family protein, partial [Erysipelotrichaceae bacterium]|nr:SGNH/GDSL hydrolase family protein [Erysipelotrichaceae bacterium]
MGVFEQFPYANMHEMNLDWLLKKMKELAQAMETFKATESLKFADPILWNITTQYEKSTVVLDPTGNAYLSLQPVPTGIQLNNEDYWLEIFNFTDYTRTANQNLTVNVETNTTRATADYQADDWLIWNDVLYRVTSPIAIDDALIVAPAAGSNIIHFTVEDFIKAFITYATNLINQYKNDIDASELAYRQQLAQDIATTTNLLQAELDSIIHGATSDTEILQARVGWDGTSYATLAESIQTQARNAFNNRAVPNGTTSLMSLLSLGCYAIDSADFNNMTDKPAGEGGTHTLIVYDRTFAAGTFAIQELFGTNGSHYYRYINKSNNTVYRDWFKDYAEALTLATSAFQNYSVPPGTTAMSTLLDLGCYHIEGTDFNNMTDRPTSESGTHTLIVYNSAFAAGTFAIQELISVNKTHWFRIINKSNGTVFVDWYKAYNDAFLERNASAVSHLSDYRELGVYGIDGSTFNALDDVPDMEVGTGTHTLINYTGAFASGDFIIQKLLGTSKREYMRIIQDNGTIYRDWWRVDNETGNVLYRKKLVTAGDSYTSADFSGSYAAYNGKNYGYYIAQRNDMTFVNAGIGGSTMAKTNDGTDAQRVPFSISRYQEIPADTDYLTIWFGINDVSHTDLGTIDDATNDTFYGAWNVVLNYYLSYRAWMKVLIIVTTGANEQYRNAIREVAERWGYPVLDWWKDNIPAFFDKDGMSDYARNLRRNA